MEDPVELLKKTEKMEDGRNLYVYEFEIQEASPCGNAGGGGQGGGSTSE